MNSKLLVAIFLFALPLFCQQDRHWTLEQSTLTYHISHLLHEVDAVSHAAKGKGICHAGECNFLIAAPVKSFDSGDSNRDLHMLQVTRGGQFSMVIVRTRLPEAASASPTIYADLDVQFAGQTMHYKHIGFQRVMEGESVRITGTIPARCSDFKIVPPSFFTVPIKNEIPVRVDMTWRPM